MSIAEPLARAMPAPRSPLTQRILQPGWPLVLGYTAFPVWWLLGLGEFVFLVLGAIMTRELVQMKNLRAPRYFGLWMLFIAIAVITCGVLQVDAPGAVPGGGLTRYFTLLYRILWYATAGVTVLYVVNTRAKLPSQRITGAISWMFVYVTVGGLLGAIVPHLSFPSLLEAVLPHHLANQGFLHSQIHPAIAQIDNELGQESIRPSAPFPYANEWGINFACYLPFFVLFWCRRDAGWRRVAAPFVLLLSAVPVVLSLNRGLWFTLIGVAVFVALRAAVAGRLAALSALVAGAVVLGGVIVASPLGSLVQTRFGAEHNSNAGRTNLATLGVQSVLAKSPLVGYGSTRNVQGTFSSIAGGSSSLCPRCSPPALGSQGQFWMVSFSQGLIGAALFVGFFMIVFFRYLRLRGPTATACLSVLVVVLSTLIIYNSVGPVLVAILVSIALLWREAVRAESDSLPAQGSPSTVWFGRYGDLLHGSQAIVAAGLLVGLAAGLAWPTVHRPPYVASASVTLPDNPRYSGLPVTTETMDTLAQRAHGTEVAAAIAHATDASVSLARSRLTLSADSNTRVLNLTYTDPRGDVAVRAVNAAAMAMSHLHNTELAARQDRIAYGLSVQLSATVRAVQTVDAALANLSGDRNETHALAPINLQSLATQVRVSANKIASELSSVQSRPVPASVFVRGARVAVRGGVTAVAVTSGIAVGGLLGVLFAIGRGWLSARVSRRTSQAADLRVIDVVDRAVLVGPKLAKAGAGSGAMNIVGPAEAPSETTFVAVGASALSFAAAARLDARRGVGSGLAAGGRSGVRKDSPTARRGTMLVAAAGTRERTIARARLDLERGGCSVNGLVLVT